MQIVVSGLTKLGVMLLPLLRFYNVDFILSKGTVICGLQTATAKNKSCISVGQ